MFDPYEFSFGVTFKDEFYDNKGLFVEQATQPALRREYIFEFDRADVPDRIQYDVLSVTHAIENHPSDMTTNGPRLSIIDKLSRVPMSLRIKWEWDEDQTESGRGSRVRTRDLRFWRPSLYQLSYTPNDDVDTMPCTGIQV